MGPGRPALPAGPGGPAEPGSPGGPMGPGGPLPPGTQKKQKTVRVKSNSSFQNDLKRHSIDFIHEVSSCGV